jgi:transcriptional regulator GlxA family with amidase domain
LMSYASVVEPIRAANLLSEKPLYEIINITRLSVGAKSSSGALIAGDKLIGDDIMLDLLLVVAGGDPFLVDDKKLFNWLNRMAKFGTIIGGVSGGPVLLVKSGVMSDRRMTVHWEHAEALSEMVTNVILERSLYVIDRDRMTCAGGTAPIDMMLALISANQGAVFAQFVGDWFLHNEIRPSGGAQRGRLADRIGSNNIVVVNAVELMENHLADPLTLVQLSSLVGISERQINRLFKSNLGKSTMTYYRGIRIEMARNLLRNSALKVSEIAEATGFSNPSHLSGVFSEIYGYPPSKYRFDSY